MSLFPHIPDALTLLMLGGGLALLAAGGDLLVRGSVGLARYWRIPPLVTGLTIVAFGTSAPELAVCIGAARGGAANIALGNVVGSNIFNVLFILGLWGLIVPLVVARRVVWIEVPVMIGLSGLIWALALDGQISAIEGGILVALLVGYQWWLISTSRREPALGDTERDAPAHPGRATGLVLLGLILLVLGARWLVAAAVTLATALGVSDVVIGLTIVAVGTSLPEVAASTVAAVRGHRDVAVANVLGSNVFNLGGILGLTAIVAGGLPVAPGVAGFDLAVMVAVAVACLPIFATGHAVARWEGALFLGYYAAYVAYIVFDATDHAALPHLRNGLLYFALPLTTVTLAVLAVRARNATSRI